MDWEIYERYRATVLWVAVLAVSFLLIAFQRTAAVKHLRSWLVVTTLPTERFLSGWKGNETVDDTPPSQDVSTSASTSTVAMSLSSDTSTVTSTPVMVLPEQQRAIRVLSDENKRLRALLKLQEEHWPQSIAAHVVGRDPQRWFQEIVLDKGKEDGVAVDNPVLAMVDDREGLVGRVVETSGHVSKVMLIQDSLSAVAADVRTEAEEDGVVEGSNGHELLLKFLNRSSKIKLGDLVVTSGLGKAFPQDVPIGWVQSISLDQRQLFLQAQLRPAVQATQLHRVLILISDS